MTRKAEPQEIIYGTHAVSMALLRNQRNIVEVWVDNHRQDRRIAQIKETVKRAGIPLYVVPRHQLDERVFRGCHQGIIAHARRFPVYGENELEQLITGLVEPAILLILDGLQDPHNLGACLRSADAAGAHAVVVPRDRAVGMTPAVRKVASGATESVPFFQITNLARTLRMLQQRGVWIIGAVEKARTSLYETDLRYPIAIVMGSEEKGLRRLTREHCDDLVRIPMKGSVESLNASVASAICLFEVLRQRVFDV